MTLDELKKLLQTASLAMVEAANALETCAHESEEKIIKEDDLRQARSLRDISDDLDEVIGAVSRNAIKSID